MEKVTFEGEVNVNIERGISPNGKHCFILILSSEKFIDDPFALMAIKGWSEEEYKRFEKNSPVIEKFEKIEKDIPENVVPLRKN